MSTVAKLLARKQKLLERMREEPGAAELSEIERQLAEIDQALDVIEGAGMSNVIRQPPARDILAADHMGRPGFGP